MRTPQAVQSRLDVGTPQNLANIIWSCVVLGHTPDPDWMALYYNALDTRCVLACVCARVYLFCVLCVLCL